MQCVQSSLQQDFKTRQDYLKYPEKTILLAKIIDHTLLKPNASDKDFLNLCQDASKYLFKSVCVPPYYVPLAKKNCKNVLICTVIGFPNGYNTTRNKVIEAKEAIDLGADEIDFVNNITLVKSFLWKDLENEYKQIVNASNGCVTKLILETSLLTDEEIKQCTLLAANCGVNIMKTSTGFGSRGASANDIELIQSTLKNFFGNEIQTIGIKASGGIRTLSDAQKMIALGATRLGTSNGIHIISVSE